MLVGPGFVGRIGRPYLRSSIPAATGAFTPANLFAAFEAGGWYDPSDLATMFQDTAGTVPVTAAGQSVARINDKSGRNNHATQTTAGSRPTYQIDGNGKAYLSFDGIDDFLVTSSINFSASDKMSLFLGLRKLSDATAIAVELSANCNTNAGSFFLVTGSDAGILGTANGYTSIARGDASNVFNMAGQVVVAAPDTAVLSTTHDIAGDLSTLRRNGVAGGNGDGNKGLGNFGNYPLYIGMRGGTALPFSGRLYGLIVRGAMTDATTIGQAETWMNSKTAAF